MFGKDRKLSDDLGKFTIARRIKRKGHVALACLLRFGDVFEIKRIWRAVGFQRVKRENNIFRRDRVSVLPFRIGAQAIGG